MSYNPDWNDFDSSPKPPTRDFKDLSLWEVARLMVYHPEPTLRRLFNEISLPSETQAHSDASIPLNEILEESMQQLELPAEEPLPEAESDLLETAAGVKTAVLPSVTPVVSSLSPLFITFFLAVAIFFAFIGGNRLWVGATDPNSVATNDLKGAPFWFWLAMMSYLGVTLGISRRWWIKTFNTVWGASPAPTPTLTPVLPTPARKITLRDFFASVERHTFRLALMPVGIVLAYLAYAQNAIYDETGTVVKDVIFTRTGTIFWFLAIFVWFLVLAVDLNGVLARFYGAIRTGAWGLPRPAFTWRPRWYHLAFLLILGLALYFRFDNLSSVPPEMTSDHIEKLLDGRRVYEGYKAIFFPNNGGREAFQMHWIAALVRYGGLEFSFNTLKTASGIEGMLTVACGLWLGITVMGERDRQMGIWLGLWFGVLLAISSWHTMLSRLGLRIALTPLTSLLVLIFLIRGMRHNRRLDFVLLGAVLGAGTYFYQANRMLPLVVVAGVLLAILVYARTWSQAGRYVVNLAATVSLAVIIFLPMYRYQQAFAGDFWNRTNGRMFGEDAFIRIDPTTGTSQHYQPSFEEQVQRFLNNFNGFVDNYEGALKMWSWRGDSAWISNGGSRPAFDPYTNGLFLLGLLGWLMLIGKHWDMGHFLIPVGIGIMLLPSALTIAYPIENPSFTRASGTIPFVFLVAAYPLAQICFYAQQTTKRPWIGGGLAVLILAGLLSFAARINYDNYFNVYREGYSLSWKPYNAFAAPMKEFAQGQGSYGNAFMIAYPHWLDHRILGTVAGDIGWNNGLVSKEDVFAFIRGNQGTPYQYDPSKPTFFMYNRVDVDTEEWLKELFPAGTVYVMPVPERPDLEFKVFIAPPNQDWEALREQALGS